MIIVVKVFLPKGVAEVLQKSDIFVTCQIIAFGRTALEAMACCCTAVETHYGGVHEYAVDGENCLLVDSFDEQQLLMLLMS